MGLRINPNTRTASASHAAAISKKNLKKKSDDELLLLVKKRLESGSKNPLYLHEASRALCELSIRPLAKKYKAQLEVLDKKLSKKTKSCFVDLFYAIEIAGIKKKCFDPEADSSEVIHPYPRAEIMKKVQKVWLDTYASKVSFDTYICNYLPNSKDS